MLRILRAFAWMRWRVLLNSLERTGARDTLERLSLAVEQLGPLLAAALLIPSAAALTALAAYAGYRLAATADPLPLEVLRYVLLAASALSVAGPIMLPGADRANAVRLLLLPISRRVLYVAQVTGGLADPWILLVLPVVIALPAGLAAGRALAASLLALASGVALVFALLGLSSLTMMLLQLAMRNRRRSELIALLFIVLVPLLAVVPGMMDAQQRRAEREGRSVADGPEFLPAWVKDAGTRAFGLVPSELHVRAIRTAAQREAAGSVLAVTAITASAVVLHGLGLIAFGRLLDTPATGATRRAAASRFAGLASLPGLSRGASAVAVTQVRIALRTPRGRSIVVSPLVLSAMFGLLMWRGGDMDFGLIAVKSGIGLATFAGGVCLLSILPFAMNQFAIDRAGLTLELLAPLEDIELLTGKAVANGLIAGIPALLCMVAAFVLMPGGPLALWITLGFALAATYLLAAPAAAVLSATFPRTVDLNSIGSRSNAHGLAGLLGMLAFLAAGVPPLALTLLATRILDRPSAAAWLVLAWCGVSLVLCRVLLIPASRLFSRRLENLAIVATADR